MKIKQFLPHLFLSLLIVFFSCALVYPQQKTEEGSVSIPWEEFRKLLELDKDEVELSWEEFQKILVQTGNKYVPPFQLKDEKVILTREQFKRLLDQMKPPVITVVNPPADFLITKASYKGRITNKDASFRADFSTEIFDRRRSQYVKIPLFPMSFALKDVLFDGKQALVILENNRYTLTTSQIGQHQISVDFSLKTNLEQGPRAISFPIPRTPITSLEVDIPFTNIDVEITNAQQIEVTERGSQTRVYALLSPSNTINLRWRRRLPEAAKGPAKIYADTINHISIEDDALRVHADISLSVLQNTIPAVTLRVPEGYSILDVRGNGVGDWRELDKDGAKFLEVPFDFPKGGSFTISVIAERLLPNESMTVDYSGFPVEGAIREKGFLGIELKSTSEVTLSSSDGLDKLDVSELPATLITRSQKPLLFGFKYLHHPYSLVLDIKKHEELPVMSTVIDYASGVTLFTEDGKLVHRVIYKIRNTSKQFLELELPENAQIWSVFVGGEPAKPRLNENKVLIPLNRSRQGTTGLVAFDVELIYFMKARRFGSFGSRDSLFPTPDILISQMLWSVYLPEGYSFLHFGGSVEKERIAKGIRPLLGAKRKVTSYFRTELPEPGEEEQAEARRQRDAKELKKQFSANLALAEDQLAEQMKNEAQFGQRVQEIQAGAVPVSGGVLPIRIQVPTTGQLFRFAKTIVSEDPLTLNFSFASNSIIIILRVLILLGVLVVLFVLRQSIKKLFDGVIEKFQIKYIPVIFVVIGILLWSFSWVYALISLLLALAISVLIRFLAPGKS